jgi:sugar-phosphatase
VTIPFPSDGVRAAALLLDLDGTLVDTTEAVEAAWRWAAVQLGVPFDTVEPYIHGIPGVQAIELAAPGRLALAEREALTRELIVRIADPDAHVALMPGARDLLAALEHAPDARWSIVTSGDGRLAGSSIRKAPVPAPPVLVTSDDVRLGKPDPEPYLTAAAALGIEPSACVVVEDAPAGIAAGRAAGMRVLALATTYPPDALADADWVVASLADVRAEVPEPAAGSGGARPVVVLTPR